MAGEVTMAEVEIKQLADACKALEEATSPSFLLNALCGLVEGVCNRHPEIMSYHRIEHTGTRQ
jgi:hypothetical protein